MHLSESILKRKAAKPASFNAERFIRSMKMKFKKLICLVLCTCVLIAAFNSSGIDVSAESQSEYEERIEEIDSQISAYEQKLAELAADAEKQKEYLDTLEAQIDAVESVVLDHGVNRHVAKDQR